MPDHQSDLTHQAMRLDPPVCVPEPAPLDMPRRQIRLLPFDVTRLLPRPVAVSRSPENSGVR